MAATTGAFTAGFAGFSLLYSEDDSLAAFPPFLACVATTFAPFLGFYSSYSSELGYLALTGFFVLTLSADPFLVPFLAGTGVYSSTDALDPFLGALTTFFFYWAGVSSSLYSFWGADFLIGFVFVSAAVLVLFCFFLLANSGSGLLYSLSDA